MFGSKNGAGVYQAIINLIPPHDTYIEPFLGSGAVMRRKAPAAESIGIDLNLSSITNFKCDYPVDLKATDAIRYLETLTPHGKTVIYCDPPYVHSTRTSSHRYDYELSDLDHRRLLDALKQLHCHILISGYRSELYDEYLPDWHTIDFRAMTRGGVRTETVWMNFEPGEIHYHIFAADNYTDPLPPMGTNTSHL